MIRAYLTFLLCCPHVVQSVELSLATINDSMVVWDYTTGNRLCYPDLAENDRDHHHLPPTHLHDRSYGNYVNNSARVMCRQLGFTHLKRVYKVEAGDIIKRVLWAAECLGYEPLLSHCVNATIQKEFSNCSHLMGLECGKCSQTIEMTEGEEVRVESPEYPNYSDDVVCRWELETPTAATFTVTFINFRLPQRNDLGRCSRGVLEVEEIQHRKYDSVTKSLSRNCGSALPDDITVKADALMIRYTSGIYYPRPIGGGGGFRVKVTANNFEWYQVGVLELSEVAAIVMGVLLLLLLMFCTFYMIRRHRRYRQQSQSRRWMRDRIASQHPPHHNVSLSGVIARMRSFMRREPTHEPPNATGPDLGHEPIPVEHKSSVPSGRPPAPPTHLPIPTTAPPLPPMRPRTPFTLITTDESGNELYEQPIYVEVNQLAKLSTSSYLQLEDLNQDMSLKQKNLNYDVPSTHLRPVSTSQQLGATPTKSPNIHASPSPLTINHCQYTSSVEDISFNNLNVSSGTISLTPSSKTNHSSNNTPSKKSLPNCLNVPPQNPALSSFSGSFTANTGSVSPFLGNTPKNLRHPSFSSTWTFSNSSLHPSSNTESVSPFRGNTPRNPLPPGSNVRHYSYSPNHPFRNLPSCTSLNINPSPLQPLGQPVIDKETTPLIFGSSALERIGCDGSFSSCESVFISGENPVDEADQVKTRAAKTKGHLSKSCGDVSPATPLPHDSTLEDVHRSEPSLPEGVHQGVFMAPILRRVSQMFVVSSGQKSSSEIKRHESKGLDASGCDPSKRSEPKGSDNKASGSKKYVSHGNPDGESLGDKTILGNSPRCSTSSSVSFYAFKYNRLEKVSNTDWETLTPQHHHEEEVSSFSPEDNNNSCHEKCGTGS